MLRGKRVVGIVREAYNKWERRVPLCPTHVNSLVKNHNIDVIVQPSTRRIFADVEFARAGAKISEDLSPASLILGVKQIPIPDLLGDRTYMFFSHTKKAQPANMKLLDAILEKNVSLVDYECITQNGVPGTPRLIAFGRYAGLAGMIDSLKALGDRFLSFGYSTPFLNIASCYTYPTLSDAFDAVEAAGKRLPDTLVSLSEFSPLVFVFTGAGKVASGALEVFQKLPHKMVTVEELPSLHERVLKSAHDSPERKVLYGCIVQQEHMVKLKHGASNSGWTRSEYYENPELFTPIFHEIVAPYMSVLVNCMYWEPRFPRLLTIDQITQLHKQNRNRLLLDADLTCDIGGSIEFLKKSTHIETPCYVFNPETQTFSDNLDEKGIVMFGVDILPSELPNEASMHFGDVLVDFVPKIVGKMLPTEFPPEIAGACVTANGSLTPRYRYIGEMRKITEKQHELREKERLLEEGDGSHHPNKKSEKKNSIGIFIKGHLFDSGYVNQALNLLEAQKLTFKVIEIDVVPNSSSHQNESSITIEIENNLENQNLIKSSIESLQQLSNLMPASKASVTILDSSRHTNISKHTKSHTKETLTFAGFSQNVLVLGSGLVSGPLINYLSNKCFRNVTVVSPIPHELESVRKKYPNVQIKNLDVLKDFTEIEVLIQNSNVVVSLLPATFHVKIAKSCLKLKKHLVTASYVSKEMREMNNDVIKNDLIFLNEMGLDPGMDHMSAMKMIHDFQAKGENILGFSSVCGGLPAPEAANNPLGYKFSWSPRGVLVASKNSAKYLSNGEIIEIPGTELLLNSKPLNVIPSLRLECLPNRDSLPYGDYYGISKTANSVFRGTLRYQGFSEILYGLNLLGFMDDTFDDHLSPTSTHKFNTWSEVMKKIGLTNTEQIAFRLKSLGASESCVANTINCIQWLGLFSNEQLVLRNTLMDTFCALLEQKLVYKQKERDMVVMQHLFEVEKKDKKIEKHSSTFICYGDVDGDTAMSKTVGITAAIGVELVMQSRITGRGVLLPTSPEVYRPALELLEKEGFQFVEESY